MELIILKPGTDYPPTVPPKCPPTHPYALIPSRCGVCSHPQGVVCTHTLKVWCVLIPSRCGVCSYPQGVVCCPVSLQSLLPPPLDSQIPCDFHAAKGLWQRVQLHVRQKPGQRSGLLRHSAHGPCVRPSPDGPVRTAKGLGLGLRLALMGLSGLRKDWARMRKLTSGAGFHVHRIVRRL